MITWQAFIWIVAAWAAGPSAPPIQRLSELGLRIEFRAPHSSGGESTQALGDRELIEMVFKSGELRLEASRIRPIERQAAERYASDQQSRLRALYEPKMTGGFPALSDRGCSRDRSPVFLDRNKDRLWGAHLWADAHFHPGECDPKKTAYRMTTAYTYCAESRSLFILRSFVPASTSSDSGSVLRADCVTSSQKS